MREKNEIFKKIYENKWSPYLFLVITYIPILLFVQNYIGDDVFFAEQLNQLSLMEYLSNRYQNWTSRILIEAIMLPMYKLGLWGWKILNLFFYIVLFWGTATIVTKKTQKEMWLMTLLFLLIPIDIYRGCGWVAVSLNYMWPFACGIIALIPLKREWNGEKVTKSQWMLSCVCLLFAANQEQILAFLLMTYVLAIAAFIWKKKKISMGILVHGIILLASFCFFVSCPGNAIRSQAEMETKLPAFQNYSILDKISIGFLDTFVYYVGAYRFQFVFFDICTILILVYWKKCQYIFEKMMLIGLMMLAVGVGFFGNALKYIGKLPTAIDFFYNNRVLEESGTSKIFFGIEIAIYLLVLISILWFLIQYKLWETVGYNWYLICILGIGFVSRAMIGFSPSIYESGARIALLCTLCMVVLIEQLLMKVELSKWNKLVIAGLVCVSALRSLALLAASGN